MGIDITNSIKPRQAAASRNIRDWRRLLWVAPLAIAAATISNVIFYYVLTEWIGEPLLMKTQFPPPVLSSMNVSEVILFSIMFSLGASFVYSFLSAVTQRPERNFIIISAVVLLLSFGLPLKIPAPPVAMSAKFSLVSMHIIGAIVVVGLLVGFGRKRS